MPFPNTKKSDDVKAKPHHFRLVAANGQPMHAPGQHFATSLLSRSGRIRPSAKQSHTIALAHKGHQPRANDAHPEEDVRLSWSPCHQACLRQHTCLLRLSQKVASRAHRPPFNSKSRHCHHERIYLQPRRNHTRTRLCREIAPALPIIAETASSVGKFPQA